MSQAHENGFSLVGSVMARRQHPNPVLGHGFAHDPVAGQTRCFLHPGFRRWPFPDEAARAKPEFFRFRQNHGYLRLGFGAQAMVEAIDDKAWRAPDLLLKLGIALAGAGERETACRTFDEVSRRFAGTQAAFSTRLAEEKVKAACPPA
jgi:hypothetical protein